MFIVPVFPIYIPGLEYLFPYGTYIWLGGVILLWLTRYTHQLGKRWGSLYYIFSAVLRPVGVLAIAAGWLALFTPYRAGTTVEVTPLITHSAVEWVNWAAILLFFAFGIWSVIVLGVRRSFLFRRVDDKLVRSGPYALVRHPQFLSAIGITLFNALIHAGLQTPWFSPDFSNPLLNAALFALSLWILAVLEDRELESHFGEEYLEYARRVPRIIPN
jgi:protein-S-isoprenylcysteine O-methyltransferase Ste14